MSDEAPHGWANAATVGYSTATSPRLLASAHFSAPYRWPLDRLGRCLEITSVIMEVGAAKASFDRAWEMW